MVRACLVAFEGVDYLFDAAYVADPGGIRPGGLLHLWIISGAWDTSMVIFYVPLGRIR